MGFSQIENFDFCLEFFYYTEIENFDFNEIEIGIFDFNIVKSISM